MYKGDVAKGSQSVTAAGLTPSTAYTIGTRTVGTTGLINQTWVNSTAITAPQSSNPVAPASVTNLHNTTYQQTSITWNWTDPSSADFDHVQIYLNGVYKGDVAKGSQSVTATGLTPSTAYTIGTRTVGTTGLINQTWVNSTAITAPQSSNPVAPASVTNLHNTTYQQTSITWNWTDPSSADFDHVQIYLNGVYKGDVAKGSQSVTATGLTPSTAYTIGTRTVGTTGLINQTWVNSTAITAPQSSNPVAPASVTNLHNTTYQQTSITWTWTDPSSADFDHVQIYLNGVFKDNVAKGSRRVTATGLTPSTAYTIGTRTVGTTGLINQTWVNSTATTAPQSPIPVPPASVTNLHNTTYQQTSITWTWTDPSSADFDHVQIYLNGVFKNNVAKGTQTFTATGLTSSTAYTIGTRTVGTTGLVNQTWVNSTAKTAPLPVPNLTVTCLATTIYPG